MKQALTAGGLLSVWFESAKSALSELGIDYQENRDVPSLNGIHSEFGRIQIEFFVPVQGKTRMEIAVDNSQLIADFKTKVIPAYQYISELVIRQTKEKMEEEEEQPETAIHRPESAQKLPQSVQEETERQEIQTTSEMLFNDEIPQSVNEDSKKTEDSDELEIKDVPQSGKKEKFCKKCGTTLREGIKVCPECGKKNGNGVMITLIIVGAVIILGAIGAIVYFVTSGKNQSTTTSTNTTSNTEQTTTENQTTQTTVVLVTADQFQQIELGMTYEQVCAVFGREGTFLEPETQVENESGGVSTLRTYYWEAQGAEGANVCVTFKDGVAVTTSQFGLQ